MSSTKALGPSSGPKQSTNASLSSSSRKSHFIHPPPFPSFSTFGNCSSYQIVIDPLHSLANSGIALVLWTSCYTGFSVVMKYARPWAFNHPYAPPWRHHARYVHHVHHGRHRICLCVHRDDDPCLHQHCSSVWGPRSATCPSRLPA